MENDATAGERTINVGLGAVVAVVATVAAVWRRSPRLLLLALASAAGEVAYRRWLASRS